jgi:hypothetical protein
VGVLTLALVVMGWLGRESPPVQHRSPTSTVASAVHPDIAQQPPAPVPAVSMTQTAATGAQAGSSASAEIPALELIRTRSLQAATLPIATRDGRLSIATVDGYAVLRINDQNLGQSRARAIRLTQHAAFSDRDIVTGLTDCEQVQPGCPGRVPFWLTLLDDDVEYRRLDARTASGAGEVTTLPSGVHVDLGVWDGVRRTGMLTSHGDPWLVSVQEPARRLDRNECRDVQRALEACAAIRGCRSLSGISSALSASHVANVRRLFHETTGLDSSGFRSVCLRSCELGLTPTREFVQRRVCSGAQPDQWQKDVFAD